MNQSSLSNNDNNSSDFIAKPSISETPPLPRQCHTPLSVMYSIGQQQQQQRYQQSASPSSLVGGLIKPAYSYNDPTDLHAYLRHQKHSSSDVEQKPAESSGSVCEFLSSRLTNSIESAAAEAVKVNQIRVSSSEQTDLRQANPPKKAEFFETVSRAGQFYTETTAESDEATPKAPLRPKSSQKQNKMTSTVEVVDFHPDDHYVKFRNKTTTTTKDSLGYLNRLIVSQCLSIMHFTVLLKILSNTEKLPEYSKIWS